MIDIFDEFRKLIVRLNRERIDYAFCGGWALAIHGAPRHKDLGDIESLMELEDESWYVAESGQRQTRVGFAALASSACR